MVKELHVKFLLPFSVDLPNGVYGIQSENFFCTVNFKQKIIRENASGMVGGMHLSDDRFGLTNHTSVLARFLLKNEIESSKISNKQLKLFSLEAVNLILDQCRYQNSSFYNHDIVSRDVSGTEYQYYGSDGEPVSRLSLLLGGGGTMILSTSGSTVKEDAIKRIQRHLSKDIRLPFEIELIKNAIDFFRFENFRMVAIEIETAIEVTYAFILREYLSNLQQTDSTQVQAYLDSSNLDNCTIDKFPRSHWDKIKPVLRAATFDAIAGETECQNWREKCQDLRHKVVHGGYEPSENEAEESVKSGIEFFKILQTYHSKLCSEIIAFDFPPKKSGEFSILDDDDKINFSKNNFVDISQIDVDAIQEKNKELFQYRKDKDFVKIISTYEELLKHDPCNVTFWLEKGNAHFNNKEYSNAKQCYEKCIEFDNAETDAFVGLGNVQSISGNISDALSNYLDALRRNPEHLLAIKNRAITLFQNNYFDDARCQFKQVVEKNPNDVDSLYTIAIIEAYMDHKEETIKFLDQAIRLDRNRKEDALTERAFEKYYDDEDFKKCLEL